MNIRLKKVARNIDICAMLSIAGFLGACNSGEERETEGPVNLELVDPTGREVVFWYQHTRQREEELLALIGDFNRVNPHHIQVRGEYAGTYKDIYNKMLVALQVGALPQLVVAYQNQARAYYQAEGIVDLTAYIDSPKWGLSSEARGDYFTAFIEQDNIQGVQMGFPPNRSMEILYYNSDWLNELGYEAPPRSWSQFAEMCRMASNQPFSKSTNTDHSLGFLMDADASRLASMTFSRGGDFMNEDRTNYTLHTPQVKASLALIRGLTKEGAAGLLGEPYGDTSEFSLGRVLFALRSSSGMPFFKSGVESGVGFGWGIAAPPYEGETPTVNIYGASVSICRTTPGQQLAAWLFVKWFTEPAQQARWVRASNYFPVRKSTATELEDYFAENPNYENAYGLLPYGKSEPVVMGYGQVRRKIADAVVEALEGGNIDQVLRRLEYAANNTLEDYLGRALQDKKNGSSVEDSR